MAAKSVSRPRPLSEPDPGLQWRHPLALQLHGHGVEFGPGIHPLRLGPFVESIRYCDAHDARAYRSLWTYFPASEAALFPKIDYRVHFDREPFVDLIGAGTLDFVVANHVLEHLINPLSFLEQCYQLLKPGGLIYLGLPDKRRMFDRFRQRTPLEDVIVRYEERVHETSDERIFDALRTTEGEFDVPYPGEAGFAEQIELNRRRTVHVNVWIMDDVIELLQYFGRTMGMPLALVDGTMGGIEFILVLRKSHRPEVLDMYPMVVQRIQLECHCNLTEVKDQLNVIYGLMMRLRDRIVKIARWPRFLRRHS